MKLLGSAILAATLALTAGAALAENTTDKVENGAKQTGKTVDRGASAVGKGASKIYHDTASGVHKVIGKNAGTDRTRAKHLRKSEIHHEHAAKKAQQSEKDLNKASDSADKVTDPNAPSTPSDDSTK